MAFVKRHWKVMALVLVLAGAAGGFGVWWTLFRVSPEHRAADVANQQALEALDDALGLEDDDFPAIEPAATPEPPSAQAR